MACHTISSAQTIADWLSEARRAVAFTGAGVSTESGIADFRSPDGVWARRHPVMYDDFLRSEDARREYWSQKSEIHPTIRDAMPNVAHRALAELEQNFGMRGVITQNIDGLQQMAGSRNVLELHGTAREVSCLDCRARVDADGPTEQFCETGEVPCCEVCGGRRMKHATISFGQSLLQDVLHEATQWAAASDLFLVLGSSLVVQPAAGLPVLAKRNSARLVIINRDPTPLDEIADVVTNAEIGGTMDDIIICLGAG